MLEFLAYFIDLIIHLDKHLTGIVDQSGVWIYALLFLIIFCETGFVFTPFLPGDSLLFAVGALASLGSMNIALLYGLLVLAAVLGDTVNYWIGMYVGPKIFERKIPFLKKEYLLRTEQFYAKHGNKTIMLARFIPVIRTFAPFVAGIGKMKYPRFLFYNIIGGFAWITLFLWGGFFFGNIQFIQDNFSLVILIIIVLSFIPMIVEFIKHRKRKIKVQ